MKKLSLLFVLFSLLVAGQVSAKNLSDRLKGRILLQVEDKGQAYYIDPGTQQRAFLGRPADAFKVMKEFGLGISEANYKKFKSGVPKKLSGKIILRAEANGEAYYINPTNLKMYYLGKPLDAFNIMKAQGLGITNKDLEEVPVFQKYKEKIGNKNAIKKLNKKIEKLEKKNENGIDTTTNVASTKERNKNAATPAIPSTGNKGGGGGGATPATPAIPAKKNNNIAPIISDIVVSEISSTTAVVTWITNEDSTSVVKYGTSSTIYIYEENGVSVVSGTDYIHTVNLNELIASTTYYFIVNSVDGDNNNSTSSEYIFNTLEIHAQEQELNITSISTTPENNRSIPTTTLIAEISGLNNPVGIAVNNNGLIYIADYHNDNVKVYNSNYELVQTLGGTSSSEEGYFSEPWDIAIDELN